MSIPRGETSTLEGLDLTAASKASATKLFTSIYLAVIDNEPA